ncbi:filamentous hemagglutinin [Rhizobium sp. BK275]|uniref:hemagglutinin repeat-containing protein n=1 Tax=Rhizobium sp. BK275 TaxID=2587077 RepID=UPI00161D4852|nr:hemagglutinin repeat-containing protein [Rhizobium sp. BK275]MBB3391050.1 filamentous hemagglutinin [Rhizobium sp. BK275]
MGKFGSLVSVRGGIPARYTEHKERCAPSGLARKAVATFLSALLLFQPALLQAQQVTPDAAAPAANRPDIGTAPNGIPLVDIVTPNSAGLSHNKYGDFNVGTPGLILNNYNAEIGTSKLGGVTPGNPNLRGGGPASVILNEVTSNRRSALEGPVEIFGGRADVIIANPNGITCDGCGFINTPHAMLTTGTPDIGADGRLNGFTVRNGDVTFGSNGANFASGDGTVDLFDVISRTVKIDGPVYGKDLRLTGGQSKFDYATGEAAALDAASGTPEYAIDGSALGAMQAGRIKMVVTEKGAGVRMRSDMAANTGELSLSADGKISIGNASGNQGVSLASKRSVTAGRLTSKKTVSVKAGKDVSLASVGAEGDIFIDGGAGLVDVSGMLAGNGALSVLADGNLALTETAAAGPMSLSSGAGTIAITGTAQSGAALSATAASGAITAGTLLSQGDIALLAGLDLGLSGGVLAGGNLQASAGGNIRYGSLEANEAISLSSLSGVISLDKRTAAGGDITINERHVDLSGNRSGLATSGTLHIDAESANLSGSQLTFGGIDLTSSGAADLTGTRLNAVTSSSTASGISGSGDIAIAAGNLATSGATNLLAAHDLTLSLAQLTNAGQLAAGNDLTINVSGNLANTATGLVYADNDAALFVGGVLANDQGAVIAGRDLKIAGNAGEARNAAIINRSGLITADRNIAITTANLRNEKLVAPTVTSQLISSAPVTAYDSLKGSLCNTCSPSGGVEYNGTVYIVQDADHHVYRNVTEDRVSSYGSPAALIKAGDILSINTVDLTNAYSAIEAGTGMTVTGTGTLTNLGLQLQRTVLMTCDQAAGCQYYPAFVSQEWHERMTGDTGGNGDGYLVTTYSLNPFGTRDPSKDLFPGSTVESVTAIGGVPATIKSGGTLGISGFAAVNNTALAGTIADHVAVASPAPSSNPTALLAGMTASGALFTLGAVAAPQSGGFGGTIPGQAFLFETRAAFLDVSKFYGSSYFLNRIGYKPDSEILFLGDAYFENQYVEQQLRQVTGSGFAGDDTVTQIKRLLDNGADYLGAHQHALGEPLTADEIAGLTQSIVVYEWQVVDGKSVLAPVLHLAPGDKERLASAGAVIAGKDVTIDAGVLATSGMVASNGNLAVSGTSIAATGGSFKAGGNASLAADNVSVVNGSVSTGGNLSINGNDAILVAGSKVAAGGNLALNSNGDINISATGETTTRTKRDRRSTTTTVETTATGSEITAGGSITAEAGGNLNVIGSTLSADGTLGLKAAGDVTIAEAVETTTTDYSYKKKGGLFGGGKKTTSHAETQTLVGSSVSGGKGVAITSGGDTVISASKVTAGDDTNKADINVTAGGDLLIASGRDTNEFEQASSSKGFLSKKSSTLHSYDEATVASALSASGNVNLNATGNAVIAGSKVTAGDAISVAADSVSVIGAEEQHQLESSKKKSGLFAGSGSGFISLWGKEQKDRSQASEFNVASVLSAGTNVTLKARETDVNVIGSSVEAGQDITLDAARDVNVTPGAESASQSKEDKRSGFGIAFSAGNGSASIGIGYGKSVDKTAQSAETNAMSTLSAGRDVIVTAGRDANFQAARVEADSTVDILAQRDVNLLSAQNKTNYATMHEELFAGVKATVSSSVVGAAQDVVSAAKNIGEGSSSQSIAMGAIAAINGYYAYDALSKAKPGDLLKNGPLLSTSLSLGFDYQKSSSQGSASTPVPTTINAGDTVVIEAATGDINAVGAQIGAGYKADGTLSGGGGDISLIAGDEINLTSAQATTQNSSKNVSGGVSIDLANQGVSFNFGQGKANGSTLTNLNTHLDGIGGVYLQSGGDTSLRGATVTGETVIADVGGDLNIQSQLDTASQKARQFNVNGNVGAAPTGGVAGGISGSYQTAKGDMAIVSEQSGIHAGKGGFDIDVEGKTKLEGGLITSRAGSGNNRLETGTLEFTDIDMHSRWKAETFGGGISGAGPLLSPHQKEGESETGKALSAISPGGIIITDPAHQQQNIDGLRRDTTDTNTSLPGIPDLQKKLSEQLKTQQLYDAAAARAAKLIGDKAGELAQAALEKGEAGKAEYEFWKEGGPGRAALHAIAGGLLGGVTDWQGVLAGALGGGTSSLLGPKVRELVADFVSQSGLTGSAAEFMINTVTSSILAGIGGVAGSTGAAYAGNVYQYNYLMHVEREEFDKARADCTNGDQKACKTADELRTRSDERDEKLDQCKGDYSIACQKARAELRYAAAEYMELARQGKVDPTSPLYYSERHMVFVGAATYADEKDTYTLPQDMLDKLSDPQAILIATGSPKQVQDALKGPVALGITAAAALIEGGSRPRGTVKSTDKGEGVGASIKTLEELIEGGRTRSANWANSQFPDGYSPPYTPGTFVREFVSDGNQMFVRVVSGNRPGGQWIMRQSDIEGLTPQQIADKFALPEIPTGVTSIQPPAGIRIRTGEVNPNFGRPGGGTQFQLLDRVDDGWADVKPLR